MTPKEQLDRYEALRNLRFNYENEWEEIARYMRPNSKGFSTVAKTEGERKNTNIYDSMPIMVMENFEAGLYTSMTPDGSKWLEIQHVDEDLADWGPVRDWMRTASERVLASFGPGYSGFYNQIPSVYGDVGAFGTGILYTSENIGVGFFDKAIPLSECYIDVDENGVVDTLYRRFELTAKQCVALFGEQSTPQMKKAIEKAPTQKFWVIHGVYPLDPADVGLGGQRFGECYIDEEGKHKLKDSAYFEFPYMVPRWKVAPSERYGRGCGHVVLADVKSLNVARKSNLNMMTRAGQPAMLAHSEVDIGGGTAPYPGEMVYGAINADGKRLIQPLEEGKNPAIALEMERQLQDAIKDGCYFGLMKIDGSTNMTATEFMGRNDERQRLLGPYLGRIQSELLSPLVKRRTNMLMRSGRLPPPPEELMVRSDGLQIRYVSPLARMQTRAEGEAAMAAVAAMTQAAQIQPDVAVRIDPDLLAEQLVEGFGASFLNTRQEADEIRAQNAEAQRNQAIAENMAGVGSGAKQLVEAQQLANAG